MKFRVHAGLTPETIQRMRAGRGATGIVYITLDDIVFPERDWDDFVFAVLAGWLDNATMLSFPVVEIENRFMDGPLSFRVHRDPGADVVAITLFRADELFTEKVFEVRFTRYLAALRGAAKQVLNELKSARMVLDADAERLQRNLTALMAFEDELRQA